MVFDYINILNNILNITMIIPVKCFTCGNVLADKYEYYKREVRVPKFKEKLPNDEVIYFFQNKCYKTTSW